MRKKIFIGIALILLLSSPVFALKDAQNIFDDRTNYDIYFYSGDGQATVLKRVEIIRFQDIAGRTFLVIHSSGFNLKDQEGFILFEAISAILPSRKFNVEKRRNSSIRY